MPAPSAWRHASPRDAPPGEVGSLRFAAAPLFFSDPADSAPTPAPRRILLVDADEIATARVAALLAEHRINATPAHTEEAARALSLSHSFDMVLLEPDVAEGKGLNLSRELGAMTRAPVVILSHRADPLDRVAHLEFGADDYLDKTVHPLELLARVRAVLRRSSVSVQRPQKPRGPAGSYFEFNRCWFDPGSGALHTPDGLVIWLTRSQTMLLVLFLESPNQVRSRDEIMEHFVGLKGKLTPRTVDMMVARLRRALDKAGPGLGDLIRTAHGAGYILTADVRLTGDVFG